MCIYRTGRSTVRTSTTAGDCDGRGVCILFLDLRSVQYYLSIYSSVTSTLVTVESHLGTVNGGSTFIFGAGPSTLSPLTTTGITAPVASGNSRCPTTSRILVMHPEWPVNEMKVFSSFSKTSNRNSRSRALRPEFDSLVLESYSGSSSANPSSIRYSGYSFSMADLFDRLSQVCRPVVSRDSCQLSLSKYQQQTWKERKYLFNHRPKWVYPRQVQSPEGNRRRSKTPVQRTHIVRLRRGDLRLDLPLPRPMG